MVTTLSLKNLRPTLPRVINRIDRRLDRYIVTKRGKPVVVMLSIDDYDALMETLDILADPQAVKSLKKGEADIRQKKTVPWREVKKRLERL